MIRRNPQLNQHGELIHLLSIEGLLVKRDKRLTMLMAVTGPLRTRAFPSTCPSQLFISGSRIPRRPKTSRTNALPALESSVGAAAKSNCSKTHWLSIMS